jgi:vitamin B12 transporter
MKLHPIYAAISSVFLVTPLLSHAQQSIEQATASSNESESLETITVVSSRMPIPMREVATSVSVITAEEITARGNANLADILRSEIGIGVSNSGGVGKNTTLRIRGEEGFRSKLYIDGVELSDPTAPQVTPIFDDILSNHIQRVEILRGPQGLMYGADAGGVVSITTNTSQEGLHASAKAETGRYGTNILSGDFGYSGEEGHIYLAASDFSTDGFNAQSADIFGDADGYENTTLHLKAGAKLTSNLSIQLVHRDVSSDNQYDGCFDNQTFATIHACDTQAENQTSRLSLDYLNENHAHSIALSHTQAQRTFLSNDEFSFASEGDISKFEYLANASFNEQRIIYGIDLEREGIESSNLQRDQHAIFGEYQFSFDKKVFLTGGLRFDDNDTFGSHLSYRISGAYLLAASGSKSIKLKTTYGTGFRAPSLFEQDYNDGPFAYGEAAALQLNEETSAGLDIGIDYSNGKGLDLSMVYFDQKISDEIFFDNVAFQGYLQSEGKSESNGIEFSVSQAINESMALWGNYTYNDAKTNTNEARLRRPKHQANIGLESSMLADDLNLNLTLRLTKDALDIAGTTLDDYVVANASARYFVSDNLELGMRIENIFDREYQEVAGFNSAGRAFYLSIKARL